MVERHPQKGTITYIDPDTGKKIETPVTGGRVKCQWKADWAMRWTALGVDYEMCGKDLINSVTLSSKICRALGGTPPESFIYELFLDQEGGKISKSKGNGLTIEEWLTYASPESLSLFMFQKPKAAKRLYFDVIPRTVDEYLQFLAAYPRQDAKAKLDNPAWHIHVGRAAGRGAADQLRAAAQPGGGVERARQGRAVGLHPPPRAGRRSRDAPAAGPAGRLRGALLRGLRKAAEEVPPARRGGGARRCARCRMRSARRRRTPRAEELQGMLYDVGRSIPRYQDPNAKGATPDKPGVSNAWFGAIYQVLLGEERGPRFGSFIELYGVENTRALIAKALKGELVGKSELPGASPLPVTSRGEG